MMSQLTRQRGSTIDSILDHLDREKLCIIPSSLLRLILDDHMVLQEKAVTINENISKRLDANSSNLLAIAGHLEKIAASVESISNNASQDTLMGKLDDLTAAVTSTNRTIGDHTSPSVDSSCNKLLQERFTLTQKIHRDQRLCEIYNGGLQESVPFATAKFRANASITASENEKKHLRAETVFKVQTQINIMQDFIHDWQKRIEEIDAEIEVATTGNQALKNTLSSKATTQEEAARAKSEKESIKKILESYTTEKTSGESEFLLTIRAADKSKNFRGRGGKWKKR